MNIRLKRSQIMEEARGSRHIFKVKNRFLILLLECLLFVGVFLATNIIPSLVLSGVIAGAYAATHGGTVDPEAINTWEPTLIMSSLSSVLIISAVMLAAFLIQKRRPRTLGFTGKHALRDYGIGAAAGTLMFSAAVGICLLTGSVSLSAAASIDLKWFIIALAGWFFQGMSEETICRGFFLVSLSRKNNLAAAVIINSVAFSLLHLSNSGIGILPLINIALFGICASVFFVKTGNIWLVSAMHSAWNAVQGNLFGIAVSGTEVADTTILNAALDPAKSLINGGEFGVEGGLAATAVLIIAIVIGLAIPQRGEA